MNENEMKPQNLVEPLVSVVVVTYHSAEFLEDTLNSIYAQTYSNIELVVSDDHSQDDTITIAKKWVEAHKNRFQNCIIRVSEENQGVVRNFNAGIRCTNGIFIKAIAGDDQLLPNCIEDNVQGCRERSSRYLFTWQHNFMETENGREVSRYEPDMSFYNASVQEQYRMLLAGNRLMGPCFFAEKAFIEEMDLYDECYPMMEDYPMWVKMTSLGYKIEFKKVETVAYRIGSSSISNGIGIRVCNVRYFDCYKKFAQEILLPNLWKEKLYTGFIKQRRRLFYQQLMIDLGNDRRKRSVRFVESLYLRKYLPGR